MAAKKTAAAHGRHHKIVVDLPAWVDALPTNAMCLRSVAEDVYTSKAMAANYGAETDPRCKGLLSAAKKSLRVLEDQRADDGKRCAAGDRAARKFWEAKVCARTPR